jgi:hypothetical protein
VFDEVLNKVSDEVFAWYVARHSRHDNERLCLLDEISRQTRKS